MTDIEKTEQWEKIWDSKFPNLKTDFFMVNQGLDRKIKDFIATLLRLQDAETEKRVRGECANENFSDGYHTFKELYEFRKAFNAALFNEWAITGKYDVHKSKKHSDGTTPFGGGWFIVVAELPAGQISNHYELKDWDLFVIPERELPNKYDGHSPQEAMQRLEALKSNKP